LQNQIAWEKAETCARPHRRALIRDRPLMRAAYRLLARGDASLSGGFTKPAELRFLRILRFGFSEAMSSALGSSTLLSSAALCLKHLDWAKIVQRVRFWRFSSRAGSIALRHFSKAAAKRRTMSTKMAAMAT
jgi:hypothetical protein